MKGYNKTIYFLKPYIKRCHKQHFSVAVIYGYHFLLLYRNPRTIVYLAWVSL